MFIKLYSVIRNSLNISKTIDVAFAGYCDLYIRHTMESV